MLSSILNSKQAILVNIAIMRTFLKFRYVLANDTELARKVHKLEKKVDLHDMDIRLILKDIRQLLAAPEPEFPSQDVLRVRGFSKE